MPPFWNESRPDVGGVPDDMMGPAVFRLLRLPTTSMATQSLWMVAGCPLISSELNKAPMAPFLFNPCYGIYPMHLDAPWLAQLLGLLACAIGATAFLQHQDQKLRRHLTPRGTFGSALYDARCDGRRHKLPAVCSPHVGFRVPPNAGCHVELYCVGLGAGTQMEHPMQLLTLTGTTLSTYALFRIV